jgi:CRP-like cAMP-binding protein
LSDDKHKRYTEKTRLFHALKPEEVGRILKEGRMVNFQKGQTIFHEGQLGSNLFIIFRGEVGIYSKNRLIAKCKIGDAFGEMAVINQSPRSAAASALTDAKLFTLDEAGTKKVLEQDFAVRVLMNIIQVMSERLEAANSSIADLRKRRGSHEKV